MLNSFLSYSIDNDESYYKSADKNTFRDYEPHICVRKSEENYEKMQERLRVEKENDARRSRYL